MNSPTHPSDNKDSSSVAADPVAPDPLARSKPKFSLNPIAIALVTLACAGRIYTAFYGLEHDQDMLWVSDVMGGVIGIIFFSVGPAWVVWQMTRGRRSSATATCIIMLALINLGYVSNLDLRSKQASQEVFDEFNRESAAVNSQNIDLLERSIQGEDVSEEQARLFSERLASAEKAARRASGTDGQLLQIATELMRAIQSDVTRYNQAVENLTIAGGIDPDGLDDSEAKADRLVLLDEFNAANDARDSSYARLADTLADRLRDLDANENQVRFLVEKWKQGARPDLAAKMREADRQLIKHYRAVISLLGDHSDSWKIDTASGNLVIHSDPVLTAYMDLLEAIQAVAEEQQSVQAEILEVQRSIAGKHH